MASARHLVVVAGAEPAATDELAAALRDDGTVRTAYSADALRESLDAEVDVAVVDAALVDGPLDPLLSDIRTREFDLQVCVSAPEPRRSSVATHEAVDAVVARDRAAVRERVRWLAARARYRRQLEEFYDLAERRAALIEDETGDEGERLDRLDRQLDRLQRTLDELFADIDDGSVFDAALSPDERELAFGESDDDAGDPDRDGDAGVSDGGGDGDS
jgi:hypothetical protein